MDFTARKNIRRGASGKRTGKMLDKCAFTFGNIAGGSVYGCSDFGQVLLHILADEIIRIFQQFVQRNSPDFWSPRNAQPAKKALPFLFVAFRVRGNFPLFHRSDHASILHLPISKNTCQNSPDRPQAFSGVAMNRGQPSFIRWQMNNALINPVDLVAAANNRRRQFAHLAAAPKKRPSQNIPSHFSPPFGILSFAEWQQCAREIGIRAIKRPDPVLLQRITASRRVILLLRRLIAVQHFPKFRRKRVRLQPFWPIFRTLEQKRDVAIQRARASLICPPYRRVF